jgi:hypothetical protein
VAASQELTHSASIIPALPEDRHIQGLSWNPNSIQIVSAPLGTELRWYAQLQGNFARSDWSLIHEATPLSPDPSNGFFEVRIPVLGTAAEARITAVGPLGEVEEEDLRIQIPDFKHNQDDGEVSRPKTLFPNTNLGVTSVAYSETTRADYSALALTARASVLYLIAPPRWEVALAGFGTLTWLSQSAPDSLRFFGMSLRGGYVLPLEGTRWRVSFLTGLYYTTTFVPADRFGFRNMLGPQLYPNFRYTLNAESSLSGYIKFSPVSGEGIALLPASNYEFAVGSGYLRDLPGGRTWGVQLDLAQVQLEFSLVKIVSRTLTLGVSYGL